MYWLCSVCSCIKFKKTLQALIIRVCSRERNANNIRIRVFIFILLTKIRKTQSVRVSVAVEKKRNCPKSVLHGSHTNHTESLRVYVNKITGIYYTIFFFPVLLFPIFVRYSLRVFVPWMDFLIQLKSRISNIRSENGSELVTTSKKCVY